MGGLDLHRLDFFLFEKQELVGLDFKTLDLIFFIDRFSGDRIRILPRDGIAGGPVENPEGNFFALGCGV